MNKTRYYTIIFTAVLFLHGLVAHAQQYEVGLGLGAGSYTGDIIRTIDPTQLGIQGTLFGRRNFDNAWSLRAGLTVGRLNATDSIRPIDPVAMVRDAYFTGTMVELGATMEFHFWIT